MNETPDGRFIRLLNENNLTVKLLNPEIRIITGGGFIAEAPKLQCTFTDPAKEVKNEPKPSEPAIEPATEKVASETP